MSENWNKGDDAFCINKEGWFDRNGRQTPGPGWGTVHKVGGLEDGEFGLGLMFGEWGRDRFDSICFKKIPPLSNKDEVQEKKRKPVLERA